jgi:hypothetical protein
LKPRAPGLAPVFEPVSLTIDAQDFRVVKDPIEHGDREHAGAGEGGMPIAEVRFEVRAIEPSPTTTKREVRPASKLAALDARHQFPGALIEVNNFHHSSDCALRVEVGIRSIAKTAALQYREPVSVEFCQCPIVLLAIAEEEAQVLQPLTSSLQEFLVAGITRKMLNEFDLSIAGIGKCDSKIVISWAPAKRLVSGAVAEVLDDIEALDPHALAEESLRSIQISYDKGDLLQASPDY